MRRPGRQRPRAPADGRRTLAAENQRLKARIAELTEALERRDQQLRDTQERELELLRAANLRQLFEHLIRGLKESYPLKAVRLILDDPQHEIRHLLASEGVPAGELEGVELVDSLQQRVPQLERLESPWLGPYSPREHGQIVPATGPEGSLALIPLRRDGRLEGLLIFSSADPQRFAPGPTVDVLVHLGAVAAVCAENAVSRARLVRSGLTDFLTGFYNRRYLHARLREELARAQRSRQSLVCLMIDIDHFKRINDSYGHTAGDAVLREVARRIEGEMRLSDTGVRFGGDEFAILLAQSTLEDGERVAERVLHAVRSQPVTLAPESAATVTLSIGVAVACPRTTVRDYKRVADQLIAAADAALYRAKGSGRNRVGISPSLVS